MVILSAFRAPDQILCYIRMCVRAAPASAPVLDGEHHHHHHLTAARNACMVVMVMM